MIQFPSFDAVALQVGNYASSCEDSVNETFSALVPLAINGVISPLCHNYICKLLVCIPVVW